MNSSNSINKYQLVLNMNKTIKLIDIAMNLSEKYNVKFKTVMDLLNEKDMTSKMLIKKLEEIKNNA